MASAPKFDFGRLPTELQFQILDRLSSDDRLKLMSVTSKLRRLILEDGPFGRTVGKVQIANPYGGHCCFGLRNPLTLEGHGFDIKTVMEIPEPLYRNLRSIKYFNADSFLSYLLHKVEMKNVIEKVMARVEHVECFEFPDDHFPDFVYLFEVLIPGAQVTGEARLVFNSILPIKPQPFKQIMERNFINCQEISIGNVSTDVFEALSMTNVKRIEFNVDYLCTDASIVEWLVTRGIPSRNLEAECQFFWSFSYAREAHPLYDLIDGKEGFEKFSTEEILEQPMERPLEPMRMPRPSRFGMLRKVLKNMPGGRWFGEKKSKLPPSSSSTTKIVLCSTKKEFYRRPFNEEIDLLVSMNTMTENDRKGHSITYKYSLDCKYGHAEEFA